MDQIFTLKQCEKAREKKRIVYFGFMGLEKAYDRINREALWYIVKLYDQDGKLLGGTKGSLTCVRAKRCESEYF